MPEADAACGTPAALERLDQPLPHLERLLRRVSARHPGAAGLTLVAFGSSSTFGTGASSPAHSYPAQLQRDLARRLPSVAVTVVNRGVPGETTADMLKRLDRDVLAPHPDLVIWQLGSNDALQRLPVDRFRVQAGEGLARLAAAGIDVVLMEPQYMPDAAPDAVVRDYVAAVRALGHEHRLPVVRRYDLMKAWLGAGRFQPASLLGPDAIHMTDGAYACLAGAVADELAGGGAPKVVTASMR